MTSSTGVYNFYKLSYTSKIYLSENPFKMYVKDLSHINISQIFFTLFQRTLWKPDLRLFLQPIKVTGKNILISWSLKSWICINVSHSSILTLCMAVSPHNLY